MKRTSIILAVLSFAGGAMLYGYWPTQAPDLFTGRTVAPAAGFEAPLLAKTHRFVEVSPKMLDAISGDLKQVRVKLYGREECTVKLLDREHQEGEASVTYGYVVGMPNSSAFFCRYGEAMSATIRLEDNRVFTLGYVGNNVHQFFEEEGAHQFKCDPVQAAGPQPATVKDADGKDVPVQYQTVIVCNPEGSSADARANARMPAQNPVQSQSAFMNLFADIQQFGVKPRAEQQGARRKNASKKLGKDLVGVSVVNMLILYNERAKQLYGATEVGAKARVAQLVTAFREALANSDIVNVKINYQSTLLNSETLGNVSVGSELTVLTGNSEALRLRDQIRADLVCLLVASTDPVTSGIAMAPGAFSVVQIGSGNLTFVHEIGHNFGCGHAYSPRVDDPDAGQASNAATFTPTNIPHPYGWNFLSTDVPAKYHTVMSYGWSNGPSTSVPHFSNPEVKYKGGSTGCFYIVGSVNTNGANNAQQIRNQAINTAKYK